MKNLDGVYGHLKLEPNEYKNPLEEVCQCCIPARLLSGNFSCRMNKKFIQCVHFKGAINNTGTYPRYSMINCV